MGSQAGELFTRSAQLRAFLETQQPGSTNIPQATKIKPITINADGTVTLTPPAPAAATPAPAPAKPA